MDTVLAAIMAIAVFAQPVRQDAERRVDIMIEVRQPNAQVSTTTRPLVVGRNAVVLYAFTNRVQCDETSIGFDQPVTAAYGWRVELTSSNGRITATSHRMWFGGETGSPLTRSNTLDPARQEATVLDLLEPVWSPLPLNMQRDVVVSHLLSKMGQLQRQRQRQLDSNELPERSQRLKRLQSEIDAVQSQLLARREVLEARVGCAGREVSLSIKPSVQAVMSSVIEVEYWLVHTDPRGQESVQHQTMRTQSPNPADAFFDDISLSTPLGTVRLELVARSGAPAIGSDGLLESTLEIIRKYSLEGPGVPWTVKEGTHRFTPRVRSGEVVSLALPPIPNDTGALTGHRLSLRMKMTVLKERAPRDPDHAPGT